MAGGGDDVELVSISNGRVEATGPRSSLPRFRRSGARVLEVGDRTVIPGFVDVHAHGEVAARTIAATVDCRAPACRSVDDVLDVFGSNLSGAEGGWLVGQGNLFLDQKLAEGRLPTRDELDGVSRSVALALRAGGHVTVLNTPALELAGIDRDYRPPEHSVTGKPIVERDEDGDPTGVVKEMDNLLPFPPIEGARLRDAIRDGMHDLFTRHGVTAVGEISETLEGLHHMDDLHADGDLHVRNFVYLWAPGTTSLEEACAWRERHEFRSPESSFRIQGVKLFADGGYSAASAAVKGEYVDRPGWRGALALSAEQVRDALALTRDSGLQLAVHANGDRAQEEVCTAIAAAGGAPSGPLRTRIEHAGNFLPFPAETTETWRRAGIVPVPQPVFLYTFGDFFPTYLGEYGTRGRFPFRSLLEDGWRLSGSSDVWIGSESRATDPLFGIWCCVCRRSFRDDTIDAEEAIPVQAALRMHTIDAAAVLGQEDLIGSLEPGKLADCVVLDRDPRGCTGDDLLDVQVDGVVLAGRLVYEREGARPLQVTVA
jgi:predicted amidohydrolase YtcJ